MTLQQLRYIITVSEKGAISTAAAALFISQPSLTNAVREMEKEMGITIFARTNRGIWVTKEGQEFLGYARQVLEQAELLEEKYKRHMGGKQQFSVSTQHYSFAVNAFVELIREYGREEYDFCLRETQTYEIIDDVARMKSEVGVLYLDHFNEMVILKIIKDSELLFHELFVAKPHIFVGRQNPLARLKQVSMRDLVPYPYLSFEQGEHNSFYFSEEIFSEVERPKSIRVRDRATLFNLLIGLNGYTVSSGMLDERLNGKDIVAVPLNEEGVMHIGYVTCKKCRPSSLGNQYIAALKRCVGTPGAVPGVLPRAMPRAAPGTEPGAVPGATPPQ